MEEKPNWNYIYDGIKYAVLIYSRQKRCFFCIQKRKKMQIFLYISLSDKNMNIRMEVYEGNITYDVFYYISYINYNAI